MLRMCHMSTVATVRKFTIRTQFKIIIRVRSEEVGFVVIASPEDMIAPLRCS